MIPNEFLSQIYVCVVNLWGFFFLMWGEQNRAIEAKPGCENLRVRGRAGDVGDAEEK